MNPSATVDLKERHYWVQLQAALTAGHWDSPSPAKTPHGYSLSWSELFRKFKKHSREPVVPEAALQIHFLSLLLKSTAVTEKEEGYSDDSQSLDPFSLENECILFEERREEAESAYSSLQQLQSSDDIVKLALSFFAFSLGHFRECLDHIDGVKFADVLKSAQAKPQDLGKPTLLVTSAQERTQLYSMPTPQPSKAALSSIPIEVEAGNAWLLMEAVRASCLEGMANERVSPGSPSSALAAYERGGELLQSFSIPKSLPTRSGGFNYDSFTKYRELWRWTERLLWRSICLSSKHRDIEHTLPLLRLYMTHSGHWSSTFRARHRQTVSSLYIRALILVADHLPPHLFSSKASWTSEIRSVINEYRLVLDATTQFPRAGERNVLVEEFVDSCVAAWEAGGAASDQAVWVVDILWWATRLTFNCPRILRHMTRLLHIAGDHELSKRVLRLYVQIVRKEHETSESQTMHTNTATAEPTSIETDVHWVQALVQGARMLCRIDGGVQETKEAAALIEEARQRSKGLPEAVCATIDLADGICKSIRAIRERRVTSRKALLAESVVLLSRSVSLDPVPSAHFHLALALARPIPDHNVEDAIKHCRIAVEAEPRNIIYWHVLALLEAKTGEWAKAKGVIEAAMEVADDVEGGVQGDEMAQFGISSKDFDDHPETTDAAGEGEKTPTAERPSVDKGVNGFLNGNSSTAMSVVGANANRLPSAVDLLRPLPDHPPATPSVLFEHALQLRMTQLALAELVEGPECVESHWLDVFDWYSQRRNTDAHMRSARQSMDMRSDANTQSFITSNGLSTTTDGDVNSSSGGGRQLDGATSSTASNTSNASTILSPQRHSLEVAAPTSNLNTGPPSPTKTTSRKKSKLLTRVRSRSQSPGREREGSKGKRVQKMLKNQVHNTQARINTISRKIGHGMSGSVRMGLQRSTSAPNFHEVLTKSRPYQASSIHSRKRISWVSRSHRANANRRETLSTHSPPPPLPAPPPSSAQEHSNTLHVRNARDRRLLSDLWLMSAATFRRLDKLDQTRGAIQEAETLDDENPAVWVQLGLYLIGKGDEPKAIEAFQKSLFIAQDNVSATIHLSNLYLTSQSPNIRSSAYGAIDLAVGMLESATKGIGWDVAEAWYLLAKAYRLQGRRAKERECLVLALDLSEAKGVRDIGAAVGWCL